jgi:hypothetical protein
MPTQELGGKTFETKSGPEKAPKTLGQYQANSSNQIEGLAGARGRAGLSVALPASSTAFVASYYYEYVFPYLPVGVHRVIL